STRAVSMSASSCAAVRGGRSGEACADNTPEATRATTPPTATGTPHRNRRWRRNNVDTATPRRMRHTVCDRAERRGAVSAKRAAANWVPILMLTAKDVEYDEADALDLDAHYYVTKPFSFVVLLSRLRALMRRGVTPRPAALTLGDLVLDPAAHTVTRAGTPVE